MSEPREIRHDLQRTIGRRVCIFTSLGSTNDYALEHGEPGDAIVADVQTAGRGQHGRRWQSRSGRSLLLSVVLTPKPDLARPVAMIAWAAVAVADAIAALTARQARIKWPNDLHLSGRKVCGILSECRGNTVVGIGLNLTQTAAEFADAELPNATSLVMASGKAIERDTALNAVLSELNAHYRRFMDGGRLSLENNWKRRVGLIGRKVKVELFDGTPLIGRLHEMSFDRIELEEQAFAPERIRLMDDAHSSLARSPTDDKITASHSPDCTISSRLQ